MQPATTAKKPRNQAVSDRFRAGLTYWERIKDDHKIDNATGCGGILMNVIEPLGLRRWKSPCTRYRRRVEAMAHSPCRLL